MNEGKNGYDKLVAALRESGLISPVEHPRLVIGQTISCSGQYDEVPIALIASVTGVQWFGGFLQAYLSVPERYVQSLCWRGGQWYAVIQTTCNSEHVPVTVELLETRF